MLWKLETETIISAYYYSFSHTIQTHIYIETWNTRYSLQCVYGISSTSRHLYTYIVDSYTSLAWHGCQAQSHFRFVSRDPHTHTCPQPKYLYIDLNPLLFPLSIYFFACHELEALLWMICTFHFHLQQKKRRETGEKKKV